MAGCVGFVILTAWSLLLALLIQARFREPLHGRMHEFAGLIGQLFWLSLLSLILKRAYLFVLLPGMITALFVAGDELVKMRPWRTSVQVLTRFVLCAVAIFLSTGIIYLFVVPRMSHDFDVLNHYYGAETLMHLL